MEGPGHSREAASCLAHGERYAANHGSRSLRSSFIVPDATGRISHRSGKVAANGAHRGMCVSFEAVFPRRCDMRPVASGTILLEKMETVASLHGSDVEKTERDYADSGSKADWTCRTERRILQSFNPRTPARSFTKSNERGPCNVAPVSKNGRFSHGSRRTAHHGLNTTPLSRLRAGPRRARRGGDVCVFRAPQRKNVKPHQTSHIRYFLHKSRSVKCRHCDAIAAL